MLFPRIQSSCARLVSQFDQIPDTRKAGLDQIANYLHQHLVDTDQQLASIIVICTHNSRRSHMGQLWLQIAAAYYGIKGLQTYSGGTEATAFHPNAVKAMQTLGVQIEVEQFGANPVYACSWGPTSPAYLAFSKKFDVPSNPTNGFLALMVCTDADAACPFVSGAVARISLPFDDPKVADGTPHQSAKYLERAEQIGRQCLYVLSKVNVPSR
ncbi:MAG: protein-tyrosine-phosphatase [Bacteroidota bacterium]